ncbi:unnamed protein product [Macrosiphum euphorbiae]|uniref:SET domain-containing protein n=1 Tax=Macrosiphum euphorbiae TaxID=13131 RepID=A0AAV0X0K7_9HEMI|nr:unnamed protein product [Macrosiphum euphorbiae]
MEYDNFCHYSSRLLMAEVLGEVYVEMSKLESANRRFMFTRDLLHKHKMLIPTLDIDIEYDHPIMSTSLRQNGNALFNAKFYAESAKIYTESLTGSNPSTEHYALALANRSAAYLHMGQYELCLKDVRCAMCSNYPSKLAYKLYERAGQAERKLDLVERAKESYAVCLTRLDEADMSAENKRKFRAAVEIAATECEELLTAERKRTTKTHRVEHLVGGRNENIPALSAFVELKMSEDMGRGVFATCHINPGDIVAIDEPYIGGPIRDVCHYNGCLKLEIAPFCCPKCLLVYYCNKDCMDNDYKDGHHLECPIIYFIRSTPGNTRMNELAMKWFLIDYLKMGLKKYCSIVNNFSESKVDPMTRGFDEIGQYKSDNFLTAYSLDNSENNISIDVLFFFNCIAVDMLHYLILSDFKIPNLYMGSVGASLVHILTILDLNCRKLNINAPSVSFRRCRQLTLTTALTLYPTISLFNHSCDPNIKRSGEISDRIRVMKAIQPIPKGTQLYCTYGIIFKEHDKESRQKLCNDRFYFKCYCQPCIKNWPTFNCIPHHLNALNVLNHSMADIVAFKCLQFMEFTKSVDPKDHFQHLNYLYSFIKLLYTNVKRPFVLYEECLQMIGNAHSISTNAISVCEHP